MLMEVAEFCRRCGTDLERLVSDLRDHTGREGEEEHNAWRESLPVLAKALGTDRFRRLHLNFERRGRVELEYQLPASGAWADAVLLGQGPKGPASIVLELKHWNTKNDQAGPNESLVTHAGNLVSHPSVQVGAYVEYCRRFHSAIQKHSAIVEGGVLFTRSSQLAPYTQAPYAGLVEQFPVFGAGNEDLLTRMPRWIEEFLIEPNEGFATDFSEGTYEQDKRFVRHVSSLMQNPRTSPFVLLDKQREAYDLILHRIEQHVQAAAQGQRLVVLVEGPPGSGKSVLAAQLWARMAVHPIIEGNVVFCTTSGCQRSNWESMFASVAHGSAGAGLVVTANSFNPGLTSAWVKKQREAGKSMKIQAWQDNLREFGQSGQRSRSPDLQFAATIVDEAHALIDPTSQSIEGVQSAGWLMQAGPQAWHIIRGSRVSIFLMDSEQSYRDNETSTPAQIETHARSFGDATIIKISLHGAQFRCGGSKEYTDWVEHLLETSQVESVSMDWRRGDDNPRGPFELQIVDTPFAIDAVLRERQRQGHTVRIVASHARPWVTKNVANPHRLPDEQKDFNIQVRCGGNDQAWSRVWNYAPQQDYTYFVQARPGSPMAADPLSEVGCPYVVRGFDFDYVGLLWLSDLVRRGSRWEINLNHVHETAWRKTLAAAKRGETPEAERTLLRRVQRGYRILMTRAIKGVVIWCEDNETRDYLASKLTSAQ